MPVSIGPERSEIRKLAIERLTKIATSSSSVDVAREALNILTSYGEEAIPSLFTIAEEAVSDYIKWIAIRRMHEIAEAETIRKQ